MPTPFDDLIHTLFPVLLPWLSQAIPPKTTLCLHCLSELPATHFHLSNSNSLVQLLQQLIHQLKYMNKEQLGSLFGTQLGQKLIDSPFSSCDLVVPIPIHKRRQRQRGYNQVSQFGQQLARQLQIDCVPHNLVRHKATKTLVRLNAHQRAAQIKNAFSVVDTSVFAGKHLLLVDDVVTTGTTLSEAANCLLQIEDVQVSVATIAFAKSPLP
ncbi:MAG: ComF family protein [Flavobacteriaceae bacterium TMED81]|nr:MAG: ComF family protein [Flavobacteriaceae bacterium TMED81]|tara:strand:- start:929 stop:1561 length:633 start_codon:yes stop_codon:yes gene_type:complete